MPGSAHGRQPADSHRPPELIIHNLEDDEALALKLATSPTELADLRVRLEFHRMTKPLFDSGRFCRHLEAAYLGMWEQQQSGKPPMTFKVTPAAASRGVCSDLPPDTFLQQHGNPERVDSGN